LKATGTAMVEARYSDDHRGEMLAPLERLAMV
jgi:hypothetical protein